MIDEQADPADSMTGGERALFRQYMAAVRELIDLYPPGAGRDELVRRTIANIRTALADRG